MNHQPHLEALESKLAFQEDALQQLSDALVAQQARINHLEARLERLAEQLRDHGSDGGGNADEPPPHY
jgi:SlyX protein